MLKKGLITACLLGCLLFTGGSRAQSNEAYRAPADRPIDIQHIRLDLDVSLKNQSVSGTALIDFLPNRDGSSFSLDAVDLQVSQVREISAEGKAVKDIESILNVSSKTVEFHKMKIMRELNLHSTVELTNYAVTHGMVSLE
jgi:aminopeptidase N